MQAIEEAAKLLARQPGASKRALAVHHRRPDGRCNGCYTTLVWWPCVLAAIALRTEEIG